jgi:hypothetical protein
MPVESDAGIPPTLCKKRGKKRLSILEKKRRQRGIQFSSEED